MTQEADVNWPKCAEPGCIGIQLDPARLCLAHAPEGERVAALKLVGETGAIDARGVPITSALLQQVLAATPRGTNGEWLIKNCRFEKATFTGPIRFDGATFTGDAAFDEATFTGPTWFDWTTFTGGAFFGEATFTGPVFFTGTTFTGAALFRVATFTGDASFSGATFRSDAWFGGATFGGDASFSGATFKRSGEFLRATFRGAAYFERAIFTGDAKFDWATIDGAANFVQVTFKRLAWFGGVMFEQARQFGPLLAYRGLVLDDVRFAQPVRIEVSTIGLCCRRALFPGGAQFRLRWARVVLDDANFPSPSILSGVPPMANPLQEREKRIARSWQRLLAGEISERPQLLSLRRANVAGLGLSNVSVADCRFAGAHNLDKLRLESDVSFAVAPMPMGSGAPKWGGREVIAEERTWRARHSFRVLSPFWYVPSWPNWLDDQRPRLLEPGQIAGLYRALRKGREDAKDEPGAADFYYGEMEMRRRARPRPVSVGTPDGESSATSRGRVERAILTAYWLVSGYGLRAWRALACLAVVTALLAVAFHFVGFAVPPHPVSYWTSLLYAFRATLSLTDNQVTLTAWGQLLQAVLRLTGPVLLGLALLALRGRVKR